MELREETALALWLMLKMLITPSENSSIPILILIITRLHYLYFCTTDVYPHSI